jgi:hypothetical protein
MTTINAMKFDFNGGIMISDEETSMGDGFLSEVSDKIRVCVPAEITRRYGISAAIGNTGNVTIGAILKERFFQHLGRRYRESLNEQGVPAEKFMSIDEMAELYFDIIMEVNREKLDEKLKSEFGFTGVDFLRGKYFNETGEEVAINDKDIVDTITDWLSNKNEPSQMKLIFQNASIMAGFDRKNGFQIYHFDQRYGYWNRMNIPYIAEGSGRHSVDPMLYDFIENLFVNQRRDGVPKVKGTCELISAVNGCEKHEAGIGGYFNIIIFDGSKDNDEIVKEINDSSAKLASNIIKARDHGFIGEDVAEKLIEALLFNDMDFSDVYNEFMRESSDVETMRFMLRGYKVRNGIMNR